MALPATAFTPFQNQLSYMEPQRPVTQRTGQVTQDYLRQPTTASGLIDAMKAMFGSGGAGAGIGGTPGQAGPAGFSFFDPGGSRIGGVGPMSADAAINPGQAWSPDLAAGAEGSLLGAARMPGGGAPGPTGGPPTAGNMSAQYADMPLAAANRSMVGLQMAGQPAQAGLDLSTQTAQAGAAQAAQGVQNRMYGLGANEQLMSGDLQTQQWLQQLRALQQLIGAGSSALA